MSRTLTLRCVHSRDTPGVQALVDASYAEYGDRIRLDGAEQDLQDIVSAYGRRFVVLDRDGEIVGSHAIVAVGDGVCTFRRLYLSESLRGGPWGRLLMDWAFQRARLDGHRRVEFWSDTRFARAHRFFAKLGFETDGRRRAMDDGFMPYEEYFFWRELV